VNPTAEKAHIIPHRLIFKRPAGTSRGTLHSKDTFFLVLEQDGKKGVGEIALFRGLSAEDRPDFESKLQELQQNISLPFEELINKFKAYSSILFGLETAYRSLHAENPFILYPSRFTQAKDSIPINGLIWMGTKDFMLEQIREKIKSGFRVIKMKIGALDWETEYDILKFIRQQYSGLVLEIRVDANGAFSPDNVMPVLEKLAGLHVHSIEQPIRAGQPEEMARLCEISPVPIALDEELIGFPAGGDKQKFLQNIRPQYIILKPSLHGGFSGTREWMDAAGEAQAGWWITSALESNVGLNAIAQFTYAQGVSVPQGLGTGQLFTNNFDTPLYIDNGHLKFDPDKSFDFPYLQ